MRLLPRSPRGTWLLATVIWLLACTAVWYALPAVPRTVLRLPVDVDLIGFGPGGDTALVHAEDQRRDLPYDPGIGSLDILDLPSGRTRATLVERVECGRGVKLIGTSADHRIWLARLQIRPEPLIFKIDMAARTADALPPHLVELAENWQPALSPDGRLCAFPNPIADRWAVFDGGQTVIWDVAANCHKAILPGPYDTLAFSADGRVVAAGELRTGRVRVFDRDTLMPLAAVSGPAGNFVNKLAVGDDGVHLVAGFGSKPSDRYWHWHYGEVPQISYGCFLYSPPGHAPADTSAESRCCATATGAALWSEPLAGCRFAAGGRLVVGLDYTVGGECLRGLDAATGRQLFAIPVADLQAWEISPVGTTILTVSDHTRVSPLERFVRWIGLTWPIASGAGRLTVAVYDAATGDPLGRFAVSTPDGLDHRWTADGRTLAVRADPDQPNVWDLWDVPPRKPLGWFATAAGVLVLPVAWLARRRARHLRREAA